MNSIQLSDPRPQVMAEDDRETWRAIVEFSSKVLNDTNVDVVPFGLTGADYEMLVALAESPRGMRMSDLAARALVSKSRLTYRVDRLEDRGLVVREPCPTDRRGYVARITAPGLDLLDQVAPRYEAGVRERVVDRLDREEFELLGRIAAKAMGQEVAAEGGHTVDA